jgi:hypothetical protein
MERMNDDALSQDTDDPLIECLTITLGNKTYGIDVVWSKYSCGFLMVIFQQPT